ncbi:MAG: hypothetical protein GY833_22065 [Aestuariibacter sp.]|nr:hypothetical protein [Aestuariibacter sp.]|tara:strand:+ start:54433 stop:55440 length:1008 start_codon:yes stop_codon:yes gene_type:complete
MAALKTHHKVIKADSVEDAKTWLAENDQAYLDKYHGHCLLICDNPTRWQERIQEARNVDSQLVDESTLGFHILAEVDSGVITTRADVETWFKRSLAFVQGKVNQEIVDKVLRDLLVTKMLLETGGRLLITDIGRVSAVWYYKPEDVFHWWRGLQDVADNDLWENDYVMTHVVAGAPSYNLDYIPKGQAKQVEAYEAELTKKLRGVRATALAADIYDHINGKVVPATRLSAFKYDSSRIFQAVRQIAKACDWERPEGYWHLLETRYKNGTSQSVAELTEVEGLGVMLVRKLANFGIKSMADLVSKENKHKVERILGRKYDAAMASAKQILRKRYED